MWSPALQPWSGGRLGLASHHTSLPSAGQCRGPKWLAQIQLSGEEAVPAAESSERIQVQPQDFPPTARNQAPAKCSSSWLAAPTSPCPILPSSPHISGKKAPSSGQEG